MNEIDDDLARRMIQDIALQGAASEENRKINLVLGSRNNLNHILNLSSGMPRIRGNVIDKFTLILGQPLMLSALSAFEIRCCLCRKVIMYPAWYYHLAYAVNQFHYFVCFDPSNNLKPTAKCYRP